MKIGIVVPFSWSYWGGVVEHAEHQADALRRRGHDVRVLMGNDPEGRFTRLLHPRSGLGGHRGDRDTRVDPVREEAPRPHRRTHPLQLAVCVVGNDDRAPREGERRDADRRRHRLVRVHDVELLLRQDAANAADGTRREHDVR